MSRLASTPIWLRTAPPKREAIPDVRRKNISNCSATVWRVL